MPASEPSATGRRASPNYGLDAPEVVRRFAMLGCACILAALLMIFGAGEWLPAWMRLFVPPCLSIGCVFLLQAGVLIWGSKYGKLRLRDKLLDTIPWRGDEQVLDVGCGHGLMVIGAAKRLNSGGKAVGIDLWQVDR
jgi:arsenite methyltransferase